MSRFPSSAPLLALLAVVPAAASAAVRAPADTVPIREWTVPWPETRPRDPAVAPDGKIWFVGQVGNYIGRLDPVSGEFKRFTVDSGTNPHNIIIDAKGRPWYSGNRNATIGRIDPATGALTRYPMPDPGARDPHTQAFDQQGNIWFTVQQGNYVGRLNTASGKIDLVKMTTPRALPYGITIDPTGRPYFDLFGSNKIGTIDPKTLELKEYVLPDPKSRPRRIARTSDGAIWYGDYTRGYLGRLDPATGAVKEWPNPGGASSFPYAMTVDDADRLWLVETGVSPNRLVGFDPKTEKWFSQTPIPSGGGVVRYMIFDPKARVIWFGSDKNTIGRAQVPPARQTTT
ncbi:MAG: lyase [Gemmatimonadetes bacterium]|nr:MAG: lyase [Gemmatimonadota bacterium]